MTHEDSTVRGGVGDDGSTLQLAYGFVPSPSPIRASASEANPNTLNLQVIVSNPTTSIIAISRITIEMTTGGKESGDISEARNLPAPHYDRSIPWRISTSGSTITIVPARGQSSEVADPIIFSLEGITVNQTPGSVSIKIVEEPPYPAVPNEDDSTYSLLKQPSDFWVTSFQVTPAVLNDLDRPVTLNWTVSEQGKLAAYSLRAVAAAEPRYASRPSVAPRHGGAVGKAESFQFRDCLTDGNCYTFHDGIAGVSVPSVSRTTTYVLDVVQTDSAGHRVVVASVPATVQVNVPTIAENSYSEASPTGRFARLHWVAFNARRCSVLLDGKLLDDNAPLDTYLNGYVTFLGGDAASHELTVVAHAPIGKAEYQHIFPEVAITAPTVLRVGDHDDEFGVVAFTPDGALALGLHPPIFEVTFFDVPGQQVIEPALSVGGGPLDIALSPDGARAYLALQDVGRVAVVNVAKRALEPESINVAGSSGVRVTPDGKLVLVVDGTNRAIVVYDVSTRTVEPPVSLGTLVPGAIEITPDGTTALVTALDYANLAGRVIVFDVAKRSVVGQSIACGSGADAIAITPDGTLALVGNHEAANVTVIDVAARTAEARPIPVGGLPDAIAITPDGRRALVACGDANLWIINIPARTSEAIRLPQTATGIAIAPDGSLALVVGGGGGAWAAFL